MKDVPVPKPKFLCFAVAGVQMWDTLQYSDVVICRFLVSVSSAAKIKKKKAELQPRHRKTEQVWALSWRGRGRAGQGKGLWVGKKKLSRKGAPEARVLSLTCIPQKYSHRLSLAETLGLCVHPPSLWLARRKHKDSGESDGECTESCVKLQLVS